MITPESIQEVKDTARIEDVVADFVDLKRRGQNMIGLCPFHSEKTPSFNVNPARNIYKCFGCGEAGDPVNFLMTHEQLSFPDAIRWLARKYNLKLKETAVDPELLAEQQAKESLYLVNQFSRDYYVQQLFETDRGKSVGLNYFKERGFEDRVIKAFELGYAHPTNDGLQKAAAQAGYKREQLETLGLINSYGKDFFRDRVLFTIHNPAGKVAAFAGRILQKKAKAPKYINSPETEIYHKSDVLYGMYQARQAIRRHDRCFLVEGYTDVIRLYQAGIEETVASSGTSLTKGQIRLLKRHTQNVYVLFDGDKAGIRAALRGVDLLLEEDLNVRIVLLPEGEDPDSYVQELGGPAFQDFVQQTAKDFILFKSNLLLAEAENDPIRKAELITDITESIAKVPDAIKRALYVKECAGLFAVEERLLLAKLNQLLARQLKSYQAKQQKAPEEIIPSAPTEVPVKKEKKEVEAGITFQERELIRIIVQYGHEWYDPKEKLSVAEYIIGNIEEVLDAVSQPIYERIFRLTLAQLDAEGQAPTAEFWLNHEAEDIRKLAIDVHTSPYVFSENWSKHNVVLNQKAPEQNYVEDARQAVSRFLQHLLPRLMEETIQKIVRLEAQGKEEEKAIQLKLLQRYAMQKTQVFAATKRVV